MLSPSQSSGSLRATSRCIETIAAASGRPKSLLVDWLSMLAPGQLPLQIVKLVKAPFDDDDWLFEIEHDGFRVSPFDPQARQAVAITWTG